MMDVRIIRKFKLYAYMRKWLKAPIKCIPRYTAVNPENDGAQVCRGFGACIVCGHAVPVQFDTGSYTAVKYEQCIGHGWEGHRGRRKV